MSVLCWPSPGVHMPRLFFSVRLARVEFAFGQPIRSRRLRRLIQTQMLWCSIARWKG